MPRYVRPATAGLQDPVAALGSMLHAGVIGYLRTNGPAGRAEIARSLDLPVMTVVDALSSLYAGGLLLSDPPLNEARQGQRVVFPVRVGELADADSVDKLLTRNDGRLGEVSAIEPLRDAPGRRRASEAWRADPARTP